MSVPPLVARDATVSVIVCSYDPSRWGTLQRALDSLVAQTRKPDEIIVVVDGSARLARMLRESGRALRVIELGDRSGLSAARNAGLNAATGVLIAFLDDDATAEPMWLHHLAMATCEGSVLGAGGHSEPVWLSPRPAWFSDELLWAVGCSYRGLPTTRQIVRNVFGGCACFRRNVLTELGGFRCDLGRRGENGSGGEEVEVCIRAKGAHQGSGFLFVPDARIHHEVSRTRAQHRYLLRRSFAEGRAKATVATTPSVDDVLDTERAYLFAVLLPSTFRDLYRALSNRDTDALARATAQTCALSAAGVGYVIQRVIPRWRS